MSVAKNKDLLQRFVREFIDGKNPAAADRYLAGNFLHHDLAPGEQTRHSTGAAGQKAFFETTVFPAFSGFRTRFEDLVGDGDLVAGRWRQSSRNTGRWLGRPATGRSAEVAGISIVRVRDGVIVEEWEARDAVGLFRQLGVPVPQPRLPVPDGLERRWSQREAERGRLRQRDVGFLSNGPFRPSTTAAVSSELRSLTGRLFMEGWNKGDLDVLGELLAPSFVLHDPTGQRLKDRRGAAQLIVALRSGLPDLQVSVELLFGERDRVVVRWIAQGRHDRTLLDIRATGRTVTVTGISILRADAGRFVEEWSLWEQLSLLEQIGAVGS